MGVTISKALSRRQWQSSPYIKNKFSLAMLYITPKKLFNQRYTEKEQKKQEQKCFLEGNAKGYPPLKIFPWPCFKLGLEKFFN